jgi:hypothetical protein
MPTTQPTAGDVHVNVPLTNFSQKFIQSAAGFVGLTGMPNLPVGKQSDLYYVFDRDDFFRDDAEERADGAESSGGAFQLSTDPYFARVYAHHKDVTDRQRQNADAGVNLDQSSTQYVTHKLMIRREALFAAAFMGTSIWSTDFSPTTKWEDATAVPISEIRTGKRTVQQLTGMRPNRAIFGRQAYDTLLDNEDILARIGGGATVEVPAMVMRQRLAELLELEQIFVMDGIRTTSAKGAATATRAFFPGEDDVLLYYAPNAVGLDEPTAGVSFSWTGPAGNTPAGMRIKRFRMENLEADRIEAQMSFAYKVTGPDLGYYINNVTT